MIFASGGDSFPISTNSGSDTASMSCNALLTKAKAEGYNAVLIMPTFNYLSGIGTYVGNFLNIIIENESIYFLDNYSYFGQKYFLAYATEYLNHYVYNDNGEPAIAYGSSQSITTQTWHDKAYKGFVRGNEGLEPVFYTDLSYSHAFIDDVEQPLPVQYNWRSVASIKDQNGVYALSMIKDNELNDGNPVSGASGTAIERLVENTSIKSLSAGLAFNTESTVIRLGPNNVMTITNQAMETGGITVIASTLLKFYYSLNFEPIYTCAVNDIKNVYLHFIIDDENQVAKVSTIIRAPQANPIAYNYNQQTMTDAEMYALWLWLHSYVISDEDNDPTDNITNGDDGGDGWQPWNSTDIPIAPTPTKSAISTGFTTMYKVTDEILSDLSAVLWSSSFVENISKFFSDPREIIIGIMLFPIAPIASGTPTEIKAGGISTGVSGYRITNQYRSVNMGSIDVHKSTYSYLDYTATRATVYLPYVGEHSLDINDIMGHTISLKYVFDFLTGAVVANILVDGNCKYNFTGSCGVQIPTSSEDFSRIYSSVLSAGAGIGATLATIATGGLTAPLMIGAGVNMLSNGMNMSPQVQSSTSNGGSSGFISNQTPFLRLELPQPLMANADTSEEETESSKQYGFVGKPTYQNLRLGECNGFTKCMNVHLLGIHATSREISMIETELMNGVIIKSGTPTPEITPSENDNIVISFMKCDSERNVIGKTWNTSNMINLEGKLIYNQSVVNPKLIIDGDVKGYNYCYIPLFNRFYYIDDIVIRENTIEEISLTVDPLNSFRTAIKSCRAVVERQETKGNLYMVDSHMWTKANKEVVTIPFEGGEYEFFSDGMQNFPRGNNTYILIIAGSDRNT